MTANEKKLNIKFSVVLGLYWMICAVSGIFMVPILREKGMDNGQIGMLLSIRSLATLGISPIIASFSDKHPKIQLKHILIVLAVINIINTVIFQFVSMNFITLVLIMVVLGGSSNTMPPLHSSIGMKFNKPGNTIIYSIGRGTGSVTYAFAALGLGYIVGDDHLYMALVIQILLDVVMIISLLVFPNYNGEEETESQEVLGHLKGTAAHTSIYLMKHYKYFTLFLLASAFMFVGYSMCNSFLIDVILAKGGNNSHMGIANFILGISELPTAILFQRLKKRFGVYKLLRISATFSLLKMVFLYFSPNVFWICASQVLQMLGNGMYWSTSVYYVNEVIPREDLVKGQSLATIFSVNIGGILGTMFSGQLLNYFDVNGLILFGCACSLVGAFIMFAAMRQRKE
jgi:PPP family 3-phenylpropionic acid transporter